VDRPPPGWMFRVAARAVIIFVRLMGWRLDVQGVDNVPRTGGAVVTFNHHSYADFFMCAWAVYRELGRPVRFLAKEEVFKKPVLGWILRSAKQVPVARGSRAGRKQAYEKAVRALEEGEIIAIAPEQTVSESFELLPFTTGAARMARDAGVPLVPHVNWGTHRWATKNRPVNWRARRIPVLVRYAEPMHVGPDDNLREATGKLRTTMARLLDEIQRSYPDDPRPGDDWWQPRRLGGSAPDHEEFIRRHREREARWRGEGS
jgi:1-acyl-sn-glycerol-3-phosphate acyltransferase